MRTKLSAIIIVTAMMLVSVVVNVSDNAKAEFMAPVANYNAPFFTPYDVAWNDAGTMAVVVGDNSSGGYNAYAYWPLNDSWDPIPGYSPGQILNGVTYYSPNATNGTPPAGSIDSALVVDADAYNEGTSNYYGLALLNNSVSTVDLWDVYGNFGAPQGKPTAANMAPYDAVFWVPDREMDALGMQGSPGGPFNATDESNVGTYLAAGGNFMLANTYWSQYTSASEGPYDFTAGDFAYDYFGLDKIWDISSNYDSSVNETVGDAAYDGIGTCNLNWNGGGWNHAPPPVGVNDELRAGPGTICFFGYDGASYQPMGIRYDIGVFRTVFFGFPLETLSGTDRDNIMGMTLDWFANGGAGADSGPIELGAGGNSPQASTKTILDQTSEWMGNMAYYDVGSNPPYEPWAQSFIPNANHISKAEFYMYSTPALDDFLIEICQDWGGEPYPSNLTYGWITPSSIPIDPARGWAECWFENGGATLIPGNTYWIVCDRLTFFGAKYWAVDFDQMYVNGVVKEFNAGWGPAQSYDWLFRTYANETSGVPSATLSPDKDNGIFQESSDESNGAGMVLRAGRNNLGNIRRSFIHFDVASSIPAGSTIDHVELKLYCNGSSGGPQDVSLNRVQVSWGEGISDDGGIVEGALATPGDCTWQFTYYPTTTWIGMGGDYVASSASRNVAEQGEFYTWGSTSWMVSNVQGWLDTPGSNYGWAIIGDESMDGYTKEFSSRESDVHTRRPELKIFYTLPATGPFQFSITPEKDNTIYSNMPPPEWSNGWGDNLFAGMDAGGDIKRALMKFDVEGSIPDGATITGVNLTMYCDKVDNNNPETLRINRLTTDWGEAGSHALGEEENPAGAQPGDATWNYPILGGPNWVAPGGDFIAAPSASTTVHFADVYYRWSSATVISDVQGWLDNPGTNNGWILIGNEGTPQTIKRFSSRSNRTVAQRPMLNITYTMGSGSGGNESLDLGYFWICGDYPGGAPTSVYNIDLSQGIYLNSTPSASWAPLTSIACDNLGNPLTVGSGLGSMHYYNVTADSWFSVGSGLNAYNYHGVDFNPNDNRFYAVGERFTVQWVGTTFYTDPVPLAGGANCYRDLSTFSDSKNTYNSIAWNHEMNYGMIAANGGVYLVDPYGGGPQSLNWTSKVNNSINYYLDVSWDTDGYNEAAIVGTNGSGHAYYWRYYHTNPQVMYGYHDMGIPQFICCDFKPPSSPKWLLIPVPNGGWRANVLEDDQSSQITLNANYPHIFNVGFWLQSDIFETPLLNTPVDPGTTYTFFIEGNWTVSGMDRWDDVAVNITAWYDESQVGNPSNPGDPSWSLDDFRTRQFNMTYLESAKAGAMNYPLGPPNEFNVHSTYSDPGTYGPDNSWHRLYINVTFKEQTLAAPGPFINGPPMVPHWDKNALNDQWTWDFYVDLYDGTAGPATDIRNRSYDEFGIKKAVSILTSGSPNGGAPPGSNNVVLNDPSQLTYSSNTNYFVNVSIPHLYKDGNDLSPYWIPATDVEVLNAHPDATGANSDISTWTAFPGPGLDRCVWGLTIPLTSMVPVFHGTVSAGPLQSDYNTPGLYTEVQWRVSVPVSLPEGVYFGTITLSIEDY